MKKIIHEGNTKIEEIQPKNFDKNVLQYWASKRLVDKIQSIETVDIL